jgi:Domain of unknown function (DUF4335)
MPLSKSVLHRYTPPTCTLQIVAHSSPVSRWFGSKVVKEVQFDLRFDDPRSPGEKQFSITGDRQQLEALHTVVTNYIQELLNLSPENFATLGQETLPPTSVTPSLPLDDDVEGDVWLTPNDSISPASPEIELSTDAIARNKSAAKSEYMQQTASGIKAAITQGEFIDLKPASKVAHNLFLGSLATVETGKFVQLSVLQLFDLATALDEYEQDLIALPTFPRNQNSPLLAWANIAAVLLLGVGVTAVGLQVYNRPNSPQTANNINNRPKATPNPQVALAPSPFPSLSPANTILVPSPNSSIPPTGAIAPPSTAPVSQTATPSTKNAPVPNGLPPQPVVMNPPAAQTTTTVTIPQTSNQTPPIVILPSPNLSPLATPNPAATNTTVEQQDSNSSEAPTPPKPITTATRTAFVANPQVAEVSNYFNGRWEPPSSLRSSLEYSIILDVDGSIQVIEPYGLASRTYLDRTGMPLIGERFVSANQDGKSPRIRLRFNPNGKVQAFLEAGDAR